MPENKQWFCFNWPKKKNHPTSTFFSLLILSIVIQPNFGNMLRGRRSRNQMVNTFR